MIYKRIAAINIPCNLGTVSYLSDTYSHTEVNLRMKISRKRMDVYAHIAAVMTQHLKTHS